MVWSIGGKAKSDPTIEVASVRGTPKRINKYINSFKKTRETKPHLNFCLFTFQIRIGNYAVSRI